MQSYSVASRRETSIYGDAQAQKHTLFEQEGIEKEDPRESQEEQFLLQLRRFQRFRSLFPLKKS